MTEYDEHIVDDLSSFLKCPTCHRSTTVSLVMHQDRDITIMCGACGAMAIGHKLHEHDRAYE